MNIQDQMAYPWNFWLAIIMKAARVGITVIFFKAIYLKVNNISGWNYADTIFIFATFSLIDFVSNTTFLRNFAYWFSDLLRNGEYDYRIIKPINLQFFTAFWVIDFMDLTTIVPIAILYWYAISQMSVIFSAANIALYFILVINAIIFLYSFALILATFNFWTVQSSGLGRFTQSIFYMARYPTDIYSGIFKTVFSFILPIAFIATWPAKAFLGTLNWQNIVYALIFTMVFFWLANRFWNYGLKHYSSASS
jgi:ABC-2 type transport system permease protein